MLAAVVGEHEPLIEADLRRFFGVRWTDRWRRDEHGHRKLTLREAWVYLQTLPDDSALVIALNKGAPRFGTTDYVLMDLFEGLTGRRYPRRPKTKDEIVAEAAKEAEQARRIAVGRERFALNEKRRLEGE